MFTHLVFFFIPFRRLRSWGGNEGNGYRMWTSLCGSLGPNTEKPPQIVKNCLAQNETPFWLPQILLFFSNVPNQSSPLQALTN
jgi:hypothetical protein